MKIAFVGKICSGKTTLSNLLIEKFNKYNINFTKISFADNVYKIAYDIFNMKEKNRELLQSIGTKMREIDPNVWINSTLKNISENVIIDDARYINEIMSLKEHNFILIKLNISNELQLKRLKNTYKESWQNHDLNHQSEIQMNTIDNNIFNIIINIDTYDSVEDIIEHIFTSIQTIILIPIQQ